MPSSRLHSLRKTSMNSWPMILRLRSGSVTPASLSRNRSSAPADARAHDRVPPLPQDVEAELVAVVGEGRREVGDGQDGVGGLEGHVGVHGVHCSARKVADRGAVAGPLTLATFGVVLRET